MKDGFVKVGTVTPDVYVADCKENATSIITNAIDAAELGVKLLVFPELSITGYTCNDLFLQDTLLLGAEKELLHIMNMTAELDMLIAVGLPIEHNSRLYNVAAMVCHGELLGMVPKSFVPGYSEFYESRQFAGWTGENTTYRMKTTGQDICLGTKQLFACLELQQLVVGAEICEDVWMPIAPSSYHALAGATVLLNLSASDETTGKAAYRRELIRSQSARTLSAYLYADAGGGESSTDLVFAGHDLIVENGVILAESVRFGTPLIVTEIDVQKLSNERRRMTTIDMQRNAAGYETHYFSLKLADTALTRSIEKAPFVPAVKGNRDERCNEILSIQSAGLRKRLEHIGCKHAVIGISGGLDSTLALLVTVRAFDSLSLPREDIICVTMPCFGTTNRTYDNAVDLARKLGTTLREIPIELAVRQHFKDIGHDINEHDITYENGQARERTQILMNIANQAGAIVIGTGDLSELALGWATYNGDHMSMYGVNCSVPKTLVRFLVLYYADTCEDINLKSVLYDILATPVSPELLPPTDGEISQKTEDIVGPYELHDFFLYHMMRFGFRPSKIYRMAVYAFRGDYSEQVILKWLRKFYWRFFSQQFKRSCLPDGPKVGSVALSPRGDWRMPSDAVVALWKEDLDDCD